MHGAQRGVGRPAASGSAPSPPPATSFSVLAVADLLEPVHDSPVDSLLQRDVAHRCRRRGAVPVFYARRNPDYVPRLDLPACAAPLLHPAGTGRHDEDLTGGMRVP